MSIGQKRFLEYYHRGDQPYSFGGKKQIKNFIDIANNSLDNVLSKSDVYTEFKEFKKPKFTPPIRTYKANYLWEADLMFFTHPDFARANDGKLYILAIIDTFTKWVYMTRLKDKTAKTVTRVVGNLFRDDEIETPNYLRVDAGGEFINKEFINMCKSFDVKLYIAMEPIKCAYIERFNRTFKRILVQLMEHYNSIRWVDYVEQALEIYNTRVHTSIGMSPEAAVEKKNQKIILRKYLKRYANYDKKRVEKNRRKPKFKKGQMVKIFKKKGIFARGFHQNVTKEYFKIYYVDRSFCKDRYYLKDMQGDKIIGSFYEEYLVPYIPDADKVYRLDPSFKGYTRKNIRGVPHILVKWLGWPNKFNQYVPYEDVSHLIPPQ